MNDNLSENRPDLFLRGVFKSADPGVAEFMARHNVLLERVTVLERAIENAIGILEPMAPGSWGQEARRVLREALDA